MTGSHSTRDAVHRAIRRCRKGGGVQKYLAPVLALETMGNNGATGTRTAALFVEGRVDFGKPHLGNYYFEASNKTWIRFSTTDAQQLCTTTTVQAEYIPALVKTPV